MTKFPFFICLLFLLSCSSYPEGPALTYALSYRGGSLETWQKQFYNQLNSLLKIPPTELDMSHRALQVSLTPFPFSLHESNLKKYLNPGCNFLTRWRRTRATAYSCPSFENHGSYLLLKDPQSLEGAVRLYQVSYRGYQQRSLQAYLLVPEEHPEVAKPTFLYFHGHSSHKEEATLDPLSYVSGMGLIKAREGYVVLVPDVRSFGPHELMNHYEEISLPHEDLFVVSATLDALYAEDILEKRELQKLGVPLVIDEKHNTISGVSFGSNIALLAGALDARFENVETHALFTGYEVQCSSFHHSCQCLKPLLHQANIFDVALLIYPRRLQVVLGLDDKFSNEYAFSALRQLMGHEKTALGPRHNGGVTYFPSGYSFVAPEQASLIVELVKGLGHAY